jgi:regulator of sigma E protease
VPEGLINALYIVPILAVLILVHEFGHFFAARAVGAKVEEFGIGIPPRMKGWERNGVLWSLNWIPFGGFVRVKGEDGKDIESDSMNAKSPAQRAFFLAAGSAMNLLLALVLMVLVVGFQGVSSSTVYIADVVPGSPAEVAGWQAGDKVVEVAGVQVESSDDVGRTAREFGGRPMSVIVERDGQMLPTTVTPRANPPADQGPTGVRISEDIVATITMNDIVAGSPAEQAGMLPGDTLVEVGGAPARDRFIIYSELTGKQGQTIPVVVDRAGTIQSLDLAVPPVAEDGDPFAAAGFVLKLEPVFEKVPPLQVIPRGFSDVWSLTTRMMGGLRDLVTGQAPLAQIAGPIGMGQITSEVIDASPLPLWVTLAQLATLLSLNLAILNLLPLPALDGGRLFFVLIEVLRGGKRIPPEREGVVHLAGMILLIGVMFVVAFLDIGRILGGRSFLP